MNEDLIYLDTYVLQQDMRVRMPKTVLANMKIERGKTKFAIYLDKKENLLILKIAGDNKENSTL
ncbi:MAG: AbrB/MazE/SpoVT family DNA-binding domain-containing protein [Eubacteriales bacterium]|nr:AbrB/MazE/SpoVT family DNA-binding domain-containing protein [Eubacteriales bacterium]